MRVSVGRLFASHCFADDFNIRVVDDCVNVLDNAGQVSNIKNIFDVQIFAQDFFNFALIFFNDFSNTAADCSKS